MHTTIKVTVGTRDRLAVLAAERGITLKDLVADLAATMLTSAELKQRADDAFAYLKEHLCPDLTEEDRADGRRLLAELAAGRLTALIDDGSPS